MNRVYFFIFLFFLYLIEGCSSKENTDSSTEITWNPPSFNEASGSTPGVPFYENFCESYLASDAFVYGEILSVEWTQEPFVYVDITTHNKITTGEYSIDSCQAITPSLKIKIKPYEYYSPANLIVNDDINVYISSETASMMYPHAQLQDYGRRTGFNYPTFSTSTPVWAPQDACQIRKICPLATNQNIGLLLQYNQNTDSWVMVRDLFWTINQKSNANYEISNKKTLSDIQESVLECTDANTFAKNHTDEVKDFYIYKSLPNCLIAQ